MLLVAARADDGPARLGITVTRKFGNAVRRNRAQAARAVRFSRLSAALFPDGIDFVVIPQSAATERASRARALWRSGRGAGRLIASAGRSLRRALANSPPAAANCAAPRGPDR